MFGLFRLILSAKYWRALVHPETWRRTGVSLRRAHKDPRARKQLRGVLVLVAAPFLCLLYISWLAASGPGLVGAAMGAVVFAGIAIYRNRKPVEAEGPLTLGLHEHKPMEPPAPPPASAELRSEFAAMALLYACLADRAGSEAFVQTKVLPEGVEVVTRRRHLDILREHGLYNQIGPEERNLLLAPDGHWAIQTIHQVSLTLEPLRLLRWVLRVDNFLPTVGATLSADYKLAGTLIQDPGLLSRAEGLVGIEALRTGLTAAEQYFYRCWAEGLRRGFYSCSDREQQQRLLDYAGKLHDAEHEDMLLGTTIVGKAAEQDVRLATTLSMRRAQFLSWVRSRLYGELPRREVLSLFFPLTPATEETSQVDVPGQPEG